MKTVIFTAIAALLSACSTTTSIPSPGSASTSTRAPYVVVQDGISYTLNRSIGIGGSGVILAKLFVGPPSSPTAYGFSNADVTAAGGEANGTYITGLTGTQTTGMPTSGTLNLSGLYGLNYNGTTEQGGVNLAADLAAGTITGSTVNINVNATINGASVSGTLDHIGGHSSTLTGGFYGAAATPTMAATFAGTNLAGILVVN